MRNVHPLLSALSLAFAAVFLAAANAHAQDAKIVKLVGSGSATVLVGGQARDAQEGMAVPVDAEIKTTAKEVYLEVIPGVVASIKPNSTVRVETLAGDSPTLELKQGSLVSQIDKKRIAGKKYGVHTASGVAAARGTAFSVTVGANGLSITATADSIQFTGPNVNFTIQAGMVSITPAGASAPLPPVSLAQAVASNPEIASTLADAVATVSTVVQNNLGELSADAATSIVSQVVAVAVAAVPSQATAFTTQAVTAVTAPGSATASNPGVAAGAVTASAIRAAPDQAAQIAGAAAGAAPGQSGVITAAAVQAAPEARDQIIQSVSTATGQSPSNVQSGADNAKGQADEATKQSNEALGNVASGSLPQGGGGGTGSSPSTNNNSTSTTETTPTQTLDPTINVSP